MVLSSTVDITISPIFPTQNPKCTSGEFYELTVDEDNVRLSTFVKKKGYTFENGLAFYEFCRKEDLQCYKEVVHVYYEKDKVCVCVF